MCAASVTSVAKTSGIPLAKRFFRGSRQILGIETYERVLTIYRELHARQPCTRGTSFRAPWTARPAVAHGGVDGYCRPDARPDRDDRGFGDGDGQQLRWATVVAASGLFLFNLAGLPHTPGSTTSS